MNDKESLPLVIADVEITTDQEGRFNLNALHKASGAAKHKEPAQWLRQKQPQELVEETRMLINILPVEINNGGLNPGTFAHELLAIAYAAWVSPQFHLQVNQVFLDYKNGKLQKQPHELTRKEILVMALEAEERVAELEEKVAKDAPKVQVYEDIANSTSTFCVTDTAKQLNMQPKLLFQWLSQNDWIYKRTDHSCWVAYEDKIKQGLLAEKSISIKRSSGETQTRHQVRVTGKGLVTLAESNLMVVVQGRRQLTN